MNTEDIKLIKGDCLIEMQNIPDKSISKFSFRRKRKVKTKEMVRILEVNTLKPQTNLLSL